MNDDPAARDKPGERRGAVGVLRRHLLVYAAVNSVLFLINLLTPGPWWFFWPTLGWGVGVAIHYMYVRSVSIDEGWADRRADEVRYKAYDVAHIKDIDERYKKKARSLGQSPMRPRDQKIDRE